MLETIARAPLIGRQHERDVLRDRLQRAAHGQGGAVVLAGEAGIGKSRVIEAATGDALAQGFRVLQCACFEPDVALPFAAVADLLRALTAGRPPEQAVELLGSAAPVLLPLLPELTVRL